MNIKGRDKEFRLPKVSYVDYKHIEIDRTLLNLFPRLKFDGYAGRVRSVPLTIEKFVEELVEDKNKDKFRGFAEHQDVVYRWVETDLLDLVNRGRPTQAVVSPRPLHGNTYKYRNAKHARDYGTSEQVYWMLYHAKKGQAARDALKNFIFSGLDTRTDKIQLSSKIDVETQAILHFDDTAQVSDAKDSKEPERYPPLCLGQADLLADDVLRLLSYENYMPRSVLVDYLKTLLSFHLALYHFRLLKLLPALTRRAGIDITPCARCYAATDDVAAEDCPYHTGFVVDMSDASHLYMMEIARRSADAHYRRIPAFIQAQFIVKKLDEMADYLAKTMGKMALPVAGYFSVKDVLQFLQPAYATNREAYFGQRLARMVEESTGGEDDAIDPEVKRLLETEISDFEKYIEILTAVRTRFHKKYITETLDSLSLKNSPGGFLRQSRKTGSPRWFTLGSRLLEVLLQMAVLEPKGSSFATRDIRIDELLTLLRLRYGLYIDRLPEGDGFEQTSIADRQALRKNVEAFKTRLREIGFFQDLSDAYITQTISARYTIGAEDLKR
jgi:hypothetical protein